MTNINDLLKDDDKRILVDELRKKGFNVIPVDKPIHAGIQMFSRKINSSPDRDMNAAYVASVIAQYANKNFRVYVLDVDFILATVDNELQETAVFRGYFYQ